LEFGDVGGRKTREPRENPSRQGKNQKKPHTHMALSQNQTHGTLVGG